MRSSTRKLRIVVALALPLLCLGVSSIDSINKYSWAENIGWLNWRDANATNQGVEHHGTWLSGYVWGENVGWINVGNGGPYTNTNNTNFGVNVLSSNELTGYAWGENIGWVNFFTPSAAPNNARWDPAAGRFRGYAWGENIGWINLDDASKFVQVTGASVIGWRSVRTHNATARSIALNATATGNGLTGPTVEPRNAGIQRIEVDLSAPVTLNTNLVTTTGRTTNAAGVLGPSLVYPTLSVSLVNPTTIAITYPIAPAVGALPDQTCYNISLGSGMTTPPLVGDLDVNIRSLAGDDTGSGIITLSDALVAKARIGQPIATNVPFDMNLDGSITNADALFAKARVVSPSRKALCP